MDIILAFDGSDAANLAVRLLAEMPIPKDSRLHVVTVVEAVDFSQALINSTTGQWTEHYHHILLEEAKVKQRSIANAFKGKAYDVQWHVATGKAAEALIKMAESLEADVIVAGSRGISGLKKYFLGSVSHKLLKHAPCSVLIARNPRQEVPKQGKLKFVVAYDGSETARGMMAEVRQLDLASIASLTFLYVVEPILEVRASDDVGHYMQQLREEKERIVEELMQYEREVKAIAPHVTTKVECVEKHRGIGQEIIDYAIRHDDDIIFLGHSGKGQLDHILLGSVSQKVAEYSHHAVWLHRDQ